jgi:hypothetical protein
VSEDDIKTLPEGFYKVSVILTEKEFKALRLETLWTGEGTYSAAIRKRMGMGEIAYGFKSAWKRHVAMHRGRAEKGED